MPVSLVFVLTTTRRVLLRLQLLLRHSLSMAWTHGLLSVRRHGFDFDWIMYGLKCLIAAAMPNASISHGSHATWCFVSLALKKPARRVCPFRETYSVDAMPCWMTEPSVTIHNWSLGRGNVIDLLVNNVFCATRKASRVLSDQCNTSCDFLPAMHDSRGASTKDYLRTLWDDASQYFVCTNE